MVDQRRRWPGCFAALTAALLSVVPAAADPVPVGGADGPAALAMLEALPIKGRAPKTGYSRALFGEAWSDDVTVPGGHNGCDTRNDILRRDLVDIAIKPGTSGEALYEILGEFAGAGFLLVDDEGEATDGRHVGNDQ